MFDSPAYTAIQNTRHTGRKHKSRVIEHLDVYVYSFDQSLNLDTDESYTLTVSFYTQLLQMLMSPPSCTVEAVAVCIYAVNDASVTSPLRAACRVCSNHLPKMQPAA